MKRSLTVLGLAACAALFILLGTTQSLPDEPLAMIVVTAEGGAPIWIRAEMMSADGTSLPDRVRQTPFAVDFPSRNFQISLTRSEAPAGFPKGKEGPALFTATYLAKADRGRFEGEWLGGGLTGEGGPEGVRFVVTDSTGQVGAY